MREVFSEIRNNPYFALKIIFRLKTLFPENKRLHSSWPEEAGGWQAVQGRGRGGWSQGEWLHVRGQGLGGGADLRADGHREDPGLPRVHPLHLLPRHLLHWCLKVRDIKSDDFWKWANSVWEWLCLLGQSATSWFSEMPSGIPITTL